MTTPCTTAADRFDVPPTVRASQHARALARRPQPCGEGVGRGLTCDKYPATLYPRGWRCASCAKKAGLVGPEGHPGAYPEYLREHARAGLIPAATSSPRTAPSSSWDDRDDQTWIDKL